MAPLWARAKVETDARPRVVVQSAAGPVGGWLDRFAARPDVVVERIAADAPIVRAARAARLAVLVASFPWTPQEEGSLLARLRELRGELPSTPAVVLLQIGDAPARPAAGTGAGDGGADDRNVADARASLFGAGASDVVFLPDDADRLEDALGQFAGLVVRRFVRHRVRLPVTIHAGEREIAGQVENLSAGGVQLRMAPPPELGDVLRLALPLRKQSVLDAFGVVRSAAAGASTAVVRLRFVGMRPAERTELDDFLASLDADTRSTEPADAIAGVRRLDATALRTALAGPASVPDWLTSAIPELTTSEKRALEPAVAAGSAALWVNVAVARTQAAALAEALEKYDPSLDGESAAVRETVLIVLRQVVHARADVAGIAGSGGDADARRVASALADLSGRLERAVSARLPDLAAAWDRSGGTAESVRDLGLSDLTVRQFDRNRVRNRLLAVGAGLMLGAVLVYTVIAMIAHGEAPR